MIPRNEHPRPQWKREQWENLNGEWEFEFDFGGSAIDRERQLAEHLDSKIIVPFCPESELSGVNYKDFMPAVCYKREFEVTKDKLDGRVILHFGAVDYKAQVYVNKELVGTHIGGYTSFEFDITEYVTEGKNTVFLFVEDDVKGGKQCAGKQSDRGFSYGCVYTRITGIWQTVWLEFVPENYIKSTKYYPDTSKPAVTVMGETCGFGNVDICVTLDGEEVGRETVYSDGSFSTTINLRKKLLWEVGKGGLYDIEFKFGNDRVASYFGLREVAMDGYKILINGKSVFQRLVLDQGYYKDGIYTASSDEALKKDIQLSVDAGFNGARLHEKVFEERFLYHADKMGYIVWGEYPNWGVRDYKDHNAFADILCGWTESVNRDFNHPSVIGWCPLNETWTYKEKEMNGRVMETIYLLTKTLDSTRPCIDTSGHFHHITDIYDIHDYDQNVETFTERYKEFGEIGDFDLSDYAPYEKPFYKGSYTYKKDQPVFLSEYGGIKWDMDSLVDTDRKLSWGYGEAPKTEEEFIERYRGLTEALLNNKNMFGFCYTQLYDVEQERNGLYTYDREPKFDMNIFKVINEQQAAIEKE